MHTGSLAPPPFQLPPASHFAASPAAPAQSTRQPPAGVFPPDFPLPPSSPAPPPRSGVPLGGALTTWPTLDTFPSVHGYVELVEISRLQRHLVRAHEAAVAVRKAEQLTEGQPLVTNSDGSSLRLATSSHGQTFGILILASGARFAGQIKEGRMHGAGGLQWPTGKGGGVVVVGEGAAESAVMVIAYLGEFRDGIFEGEGRMWLSGGVEFCGEFRAGVRQGWGCESRRGGRKPVCGSFFDGRYVSGLNMASIC